MKGAGERNREKALRNAVAVDLFVHVPDGDIGVIVKPRQSMVQVQVRK
jgi:hypothetical protein